MNTWTQFWDMHSGGSQKEKWSQIHIEAPREEAEVIFYNRFGHSPKRVTCTCCGGDYSIAEGALDQLTGFHRGCKFINSGRGEDGKYLEPGGGHYIEEHEEMAYGTYTPLDEYLKRPDVLAISASEIKPKERIGTVPEEGYVWIE